jgi:hypothetical protein
VFERTSSWSRTLVVLVAAVLAACGPSSSPGPTGAPGGPAGSAVPSPAAGASQAPVLPAAAELPIREITYSEDRSSALMAVAELDANKADVARLEFYRNATGILSSVLAVHGDGMPTVLTFDAQGRLSAADSRGYRVRFAYTDTEVEATITGPDGTVERTTGPIDPAAGAALPAPPPARPASAMTALAEARMAPYPMEVESFGVVPIEVRYTGKSRDPWYSHLRFENEDCLPGPGINCDARLMTMWRDDGTTALVALVRTSVRLPDDPKEPGVVWRTEADCNDFMSDWERSLSWSGVAQVTAAGLMGAATLLGYSNPALGATIFLVGINLKILRAGTETFLPKDCWLAPSLQKIRTAALNNVAGSTATIHVTATGDCATAKTAGMRVKGSKRRELTFQPLLPNNQSRLDQPGSGPELYYLPQMATLTVDAADCAREMTGKVDLKPLYPTAKALAAIEKLITENRAALTFTDVDDNPDVRATVVGELRMTVTLDGLFLWRLHESVGQEVFNLDADAMPPAWADCSITSTTIATLKGRQSAVGNQDVTGRATVTATSTISGCEDTNSNLKAGPDPAPLENVAWTAAGDDGLMRGVVHLKGLTKSNTYDLTFYVVRPKAP